MLCRLFDVIFSLICITLLLPVFCVIALLIKLESKGPILFKQVRVGKNEKPFEIYKFRSMYLHKQTPTELGPIKHNHALVTRIGHFIRRSKLDEIPQFFNILRGHMSVVGPRPCLFSSIDSMSKMERRRFLVSPGITGWAEVNGNLELSWEEQLKLDLWYVDHKSFKLDLLTLGKTIAVISKGSIKNHAALQSAENYLNSFK